MDKIEKNVSHQLLPSNTGKNHITDEDRNLFVLPLRMGVLDLLSNTDFSRKYEWSQAICDPIENSDPEIAETEHTLTNRNIQTERERTSHSQKKAKIMENYSSEKKTDNKSSVTERSIELTKRATLKEIQFFPQQIRV